MTFDDKHETIGHLYGTSILRCNFFFLQSIPKKFQLYNVDQKRISRMIFFCLYVDNSTCYVGFSSRGGSRGEGGGAHPARAPPKIGKNMIFRRDFSHEIPQTFSRLPPQLVKIRIFGVKSWFFTRNTPKIFAPPSARRNFFKCAPP